jgi:hypothetical protein
MTKKVAIIYGLGGSWFDPAAGEVYLAQRLKAKGFNVGGPFAYTDSQGVYDFLQHADWRAIVGDSFGADYGPVYAGELKPIAIDYLAGFQPSMYASNVVNGEIVVPANVVFAHCVRDPVWTDTYGLGYASWVAANPKRTKLVTTLHRAAHPDDAGWAQNLIFNEILKLASK